MPATPWDREYESHKGVEIRGPLHSQVRLEKQNNFVKDPSLENREGLFFRSCL